MELLLLRPGAHLWWPAERTNLFEQSIETDERREKQTRQHN